jgi:hypothetical protein
MPFEVLTGDSWWNRYSAQASFVRNRGWNSGRLFGQSCSMIAFLGLAHKYVSDGHFAVSVKRLTRRRLSEKTSPSEEVDKKAS